jgi:putative Ca2+/H+ antiporter (TMEM165/GDT1 family)
VDISVIGSAFVLLFLAELGDKTQLMTITLAHRYPTRPVLAGTFLAFFVLNLLAVLMGAALYHYVPQEAVLIAAGLLFLLFAWRSWREAGDDEDETGQTSDGRGAFLASFTLIFVAELGDKTQLALIALAASTGALWSTFVGGTLALWAVAAIGVGLGSTLLRRIPRHWMHRVAAMLFLVFGLLALGKVMADIGA